MACSKCTVMDIDGVCPHELKRSMKTKKLKKIIVKRKAVVIQTMNTEVVFGKRTVHVTQERPATKDERTKPGEVMVHTVTIDFTGKTPVVSTDSVVCERS